MVFDTLTFEGRGGGTVCCVWEDEKGDAIPIQICTCMENSGDEMRDGEWEYRGMVGSQTTVESSAR